MATPAQNASPAPVVSRTVTFCAGYTPLSPCMSAYTAPRLPIVTTIDGICALMTRRERSSHSSSGLMSEKSLTKRMPASCWLQTKQSIDWRKSRRWVAMLMLATTA